MFHVKHPLQFPHPNQFLIPLPDQGEVRWGFFSVLES